VFQSFPSGRHAELTTPAPHPKSHEIAAAQSGRFSFSSIR
jgi:hypothetical protein